MKKKDTGKPAVIESVIQHVHDSLCNGWRRGQC